MKREAFLERVRAALHREGDGPREAPPAALEPLAQWDAAELAETFVLELLAAGGQPQRAASLDEARAQLRALLAGTANLVHDADPLVLRLLEGLAAPPLAVPAEAEVGVVGAWGGIASTGSVLLSSAAGRLASLLPMTVVVLLRVSALRPTLAEALAGLAEPPSALVQLTGPSRTADIELTLATGVHGPGVVHVIVLEETA